MTRSPGTLGHTHSRNPSAWHRFHHCVMWMIAPLGLWPSPWVCAVLMMMMMMEILLCYRTLALGLSHSLYGIER
jgi:hypothetical protein